MENDIKLENSARKLAMWGWIAFVAGWIIPFAPIAGVVIGYVGRGNYKGTKAESEFKSMTSVFWISLVAGIVSALLMIVVIGYIGLVIVSIYVTVKAVKGIIRSTSDNDNVSATHNTPDSTVGTVATPSNRSDDTVAPVASAATVSAVSGSGDSGGFD